MFHLANNGKIFVSVGVISFPFLRITRKKKKQLHILVDYYYLKRHIPINKLITLDQSGSL